MNICSCTYSIQYVCMLVRLCVRIKWPLTATGGGGGAAGVFGLAAIQHSTFLCDIQYCDLRKPALQSALPLFLLVASSLCKLHFSPSSPILFLSFPPSVSVVHSALISYLNLENHQSPPPPPLSAWSLFSLLLHKSFSSVLPFVDRGPLTRHLSQCSQAEHTACCCPGHSMYHLDAYFSFIRNSFWVHSRES